MRNPLDICDVVADRLDTHQPTTKGHRDMVNSDRQGYLLERYNTLHKLHRSNKITSDEFLIALMQIGFTKDAAFRAIPIPDRDRLRAIPLYGLEGTTE